jgi:AcrR family transcriptional regulator
MAYQPAIKPQEARRDRRIQRQRKEIMDAAARLFAEKGYAATTTKDIAQVADIGESTLYGYFPGKRDVLLAILEQQAGMMDALFVQFGQLRDRQSFIELTDALMEMLLTQPIYTRTLIGEAWVNDEVLNEYVVGRFKQIMEFLQDFLSEKAAEGLIRPFDTRLEARILIATFIGAILPALRGMELPPSPEQRRVLAETVVTLLMDGILTPRDGRKT